MNYKLAVFDMDGTILNTLDDLAAAINHGLDCFSMPVRTTEEVRWFVGNGMHKLAERAVPQGTSPEKVEEVFAEMHRFYKDHCADNTKPYDGIPEMLKTLKANGVLTAVVSNKAEYAVKSLCRDYFDGLFDYSAGDKEGRRIKPYPDMVEAVLEQAGVDKSEAVYVGDSDVDFQTALNSGLFPIMVDWGFRGEAFLREHGAELVIFKPEDILPLLGITE